MKQQPWTLVPLAVILSVVASTLAVLALAPPAADVAGAEPDALTTTSLERIALSLSILEDRQRETAAALEELRLRAPAGPAPSSRVAVGELDAAIARWMEEHGLGQGTDTLDGAVPGEDEVAAADLDTLMDALLGGGLGDLEQQELWQRIRDAGRLDELIAEFERRAELDPNNPDLQVDLGGAYLQKIFDVGNGPLAGVFGMKADEAFDRALALDETHWEARLTKAVALSNWPAFLGKSGEAIKHFEVLIEQQRNGPSKPAHAQTYYFLGNMYMQTGDPAKALAVWRDGLGLFPDNQLLLDQVNLAGN